MLRQLGAYRATALHQSIDQDATFRFINIASYESPAAFQAAISHPLFQQSARMPFRAHPTLYRLVAGLR